MDRSICELEPGTLLYFHSERLRTAAQTKPHARRPLFALRLHAPPFFKNRRQKRTRHRPARTEFTRRSFRRYHKKNPRLYRYLYLARPQQGHLCADARPSNGCPDQRRPRRHNTQPDVSGRSSDQERAFGRQRVCTGAGASPYQRLCDRCQDAGTQHAKQSTDPWQRRLLRQYRSHGPMGVRSQLQQRQYRRLSHWRRWPARRSQQRSAACEKKHPAPESSACAYDRHEPRQSFCFIH